MVAVPPEYGLSAEDTAWAKNFVLPPAINMMQTHDRREIVFVVQGTRMFQSIEACIGRHASRDIADLDILDFGCGVGRVALPFFHAHRQPTACVDVDAECIAYLKRVIPEAGPTVISFDPPMPFGDQSLDCVYAISVWTHLDPEASDRWMKDVVRVLKPGGIALITTSSYAGLAARRALNKDWVWASVTDADLAKSGTIFHRHGATAGVTGPYGNASHDPEWLRREWSARYMPVVEIISGGILDVQDINVMRKP